MLSTTAIEVYNDMVLDQHGVSAAQLTVEAGGEAKEVAFPAVEALDRSRDFTAHWDSTLNCQTYAKRLFARFRDDYPQQNWNWPESVASHQPVIVGTGIFLS